MSVFQGLCDPLRMHLESQNWEPTPIQNAAIESLLSGQDRLLVAPTGSGKTEAAVLPILSACYSQEWGPMSILYVTPLRALNRDIDRRLSVLASITDIEVGLRHGDTSQIGVARRGVYPETRSICAPQARSFSSSRSKPRSR